MSFDLNMHTSRLLTSEPFFAALSRRVSKIADESIPTAGVRVNPDSGQFEMFYNPKFFETLSDIEKRGVLKHEFYHLVFEHVTGRLPDEGMSKMWNIATDLAINSHLLGELPDFAHNGESEVRVLGGSHSKFPLLFWQPLDKGAGRSDVFGWLERWL